MCLGGTQSLHTNSMDEAMALPTEKAARIALRTQQVIAYETNVAHVADPLGGSYFVEALTDEMERRAEELFAHLDDIGGGSMLEGCIRGIEDNWFQGRIADSAYELERAFNEGRRTIVGVSGFTEGNDEDQIDLLQITNEDETRQLKRLDTGPDRPRTRPPSTTRSPASKTDAADPEINLMPALIDAVNDYATLGEIMAHAGRRLRPPRRSPDDLTWISTTRSSGSPASACAAASTASSAASKTCMHNSSSSTMTVSRWVTPSRASASTASRTRSAAAARSAADEPGR